MRRATAPTSALTDARGHNKKARNLTAWQRQVRAVVSLPNKPTGVSALTPAPVFHSNASGCADTSKLAISLSLRSPGRSRHGADNERPTLRDSSSDNRGSY
jgi:hypothetical protein